LRSQFTRGVFAAYMLSSDIANRANMEVVARRLDSGNLDNQTRMECARRLFVSGFDDLALPSLQRLADHATGPDSALFAKMAAYTREHPVPRGAPAVWAAYKNVLFVDVTTSNPLQAHAAAVRQEAIKKLKAAGVDPSDLPSESPLAGCEKMLARWGM